MLTLSRDLDQFGDVLRPKLNAALISIHIGPDVGPGRGVRANGGDIFKLPLGGAEGPGLGGSLAKEKIIELIHGVIVVFSAAMKFLGGRALPLHLSKG